MLASQRAMSCWMAVQFTQSPKQSRRRVFCSEMREGEIRCQRAFHGNFTFEVVVWHASYVDRLFWEM